MKIKLIPVWFAVTTALVSVDASAFEGDIPLIPAHQHKFDELRAENQQLRDQALEIIGITKDNIEENNRLKNQNVELSNQLQQARRQHQQWQENATNGRSVQSSDALISRLLTENGRLKVHSEQMKQHRQHYIQSLKEKLALDEPDSLQSINQRMHVLAMVNVELSAQIEDMKKEQIRLRTELDGGADHCTMRAQIDQMKQMDGNRAKYIQSLNQKLFVNDQQLQNTENALHESKMENVELQIQIEQIKQQNDGEQSRLQGVISDLRLEIKGIRGQRDERISELITHNLNLKKVIDGQQHARSHDAESNLNTKVLMEQNQKLEMEIYAWREMRDCDSQKISELLAEINAKAGIIQKQEAEIAKMKDTASDSTCSLDGQSVTDCEDEDKQSESKDDYEPEPPALVMLNGTDIIC